MLLRGRRGGRKRGSEEIAAAKRHPSRSFSIPRLGGRVGERGTGPALQNKENKIHALPPQRERRVLDKGLEHFFIRHTTYQVRLAA